MKWPLIVGASQDLFPPRLSTRVAALRRRRRRQRLRGWGTPMAVLTVGMWVALVAIASLAR